MVVLGQEFVTAWSMPRQIFAVESEGDKIYDPLILADSTGRVHIFWRVASSEGSFLYYSYGAHGQFSEPVAVVENVVNDFSAVIDDRDDIHLVWGNGNALFYTWTPAAQSWSPHAWATPQILSSALVRPHITGGSENTLHIAVPGPGGVSVLYLISEDNGITWNAPAQVSAPINPNAAMGDSRLAVGQNGVIHFVWTEYELPRGWPPLGIYYTRSEDGGLSWSAPFEIAGEGYDELTVALVDDETVHLAWNGMAGISGRYHRWSSDGGRTWSNVNVISMYGGTEGFPNLVVDSANTLHLLTTYNVCAWYTTWVDERWTEPVCLSHAEARASHVEHAVMGLSEGNRLYVLYWVAFQSLWYTTRQIDAPWIAPVLPTPVPMTPTPTAYPVLSVTTTPEPMTVLPVATSEVVDSRNPGAVVVWSVLPVIALVSVIVLAATRKRSKQQSR
jgi:hypothetical protein